jgi:hypothetical protein
MFDSYLFRDGRYDQPQEARKSKKFADNYKIIYYYCHIGHFFIILNTTYCS